MATEHEQAAQDAKEAAVAAERAAASAAKARAEEAEAEAEAARLEAEAAATRAKGPKKGRISQIWEAWSTPILGMALAIALLVIMVHFYYRPTMGEVKHMIGEGHVRVITEVKDVHIPAALKGHEDGLTKGFSQGVKTACEAVKTSCVVPPEVKEPTPAVRPASAKPKHATPKAPKAEARAPAPQAPAQSATEAVAVVPLWGWVNPTADVQNPKKCYATRSISDGKKPVQCSVYIIEPPKSGESMRAWANRVASFEKFSSSRTTLTPQMQ